MPTTAPTASLLAINSGSSSIRMALYAEPEPLRTLWRGKLDGIGSGTATLSIADGANRPLWDQQVIAADHGAAIDVLLNWMDTQQPMARPDAVGHRVVHGMHHMDPELITPQLLAELREIMPYDPEHVPQELALIEAIGRRWPGLAQIACFDTAFHRHMPALSRMLPLPRRWREAGVERYGFHGLSYQFLMEELLRLGDPAATRGRVILAHLGSGASVAAVRDGRSVDTSMGFTPTGGLLMGTRSGDLDPGVTFYLARTAHLSATQLQRLFNHESGLLGVSQVSADMRELLAREANDVHAAEAIALFCYAVKKWLGSYAAALGGLDTLVFAGGIGEGAPQIRERICSGLGFLGIHVDSGRNGANEPVISTAASPVCVRVVHTDEELMIARSVSRLHPRRP